MTSPITLDDIRATAALLAQAESAMQHLTRQQEEDIREAIAPIIQRGTAALDLAAQSRDRIRERLQAQIDGAPHLFVKPRSINVDGVRCGYRMAEDALQINVEADVLIARIQALLPDNADVLIRTIQTPVLDALRQYDEPTLKRLGCVVVPGTDTSFVTVGDGDIGKIAKALVKAAASRQGEEDGKAVRGRAATTV